MLVCISASTLFAYSLGFGVEPQNPHELNLRSSTPPKASTRTSLACGALAIMNLCARFRASLAACVGMSSASQRSSLKSNKALLSTNLRGT